MSLGAGLIAGVGEGSQEGITSCVCGVVILWDTHSLENPGEAHVRISRGTAVCIEENMVETSDLV